VKRPLAGVALAWACGLYAADAWEVPVAVALYLVSLAVLLWRFGRGFFPGTQAFGVCLLFASIALVYGHARASAPARDELAQRVAGAPSTLMEVEGRVRGSEVVLQGVTSYTRFILDVDAVREGDTWQPLHGGAHVRWMGPWGPVYPGQRVRVRGEAFPEISSVNHRLWRLEDHLRARGVNTLLRVSEGDVAVAATPTWSAAYWAGRVRQAEAARLQRAVPDTVLPFVLAVFLGDGGEMSREERETYVYSGTAHILAVSGLHMGIVFVSVQFVLQLFLRRGRALTVCIMLAVFAFAFIAGARIPSIRAAVMIALYLSAGLVNREPDAPTALGISALLFLVPQPGLLFDTGFLLSFGSVASILLFATPLDEALHALPKLIRRPFSASAGVLLLPFPIMVHAFHVVPMWGPLANLLVVPLLGGVLWLSFLTTVAGLLMPGVAVLFGYALWPLVTAIRVVALLVSGMPLARMMITSPTFVAAAFYLVAILLLWRVLTQPGQRARWLAGVGVLLLASALTWHTPHFAAFLDVGQGSSAFVRTPGGTTLLIDGGQRSEYRDDGDSTVLPWLFAHQVRQLDYVVATHADFSHGGGLVRVLERMPVGALVLSENRPLPGREAPLLDVCAARGIPVLRVGTGDQLATQGATVEVLHPPRGWLGGDLPENYAIVLRLRWPGLSVLLARELERKGERWLASQDCQAEVLLAPNPGSATSSTMAFLDAVNPAHAVISSQSLPKLPAIAPPVQARLAAKGIRVWRTSTHGGLYLRETEEGVAFEGARVTRGYREDLGG
jgi:competence protein ComEC